MTDAYHEGSRALQDQFDTRRLADRIDEVVRVARVFPSCPRCVHHFELVERSEFVPHGEVTAPQLEWRFSPLDEGVLPAGDPARRD